MARRRPKTDEEKRIMRTKREKRMYDMGVKNVRYLSLIPLLLALLVTVVWLRLPTYTTREFAPQQLSGASPVSGVAVDAASDPSQAQEARLAYASLTWRELEPEQGIYDFESFEEANHFEQWRQMGVGIILNFCMDIPGDEPHTDLPDWLYEAVETDGTAYETEQGCGFSPDYANALLREHHHAAVAALGERYDADDLIVAVEIGSVGANGLWDVSASGDELPAASVMTAYAEEYVNEFPNTLLTCPARYKAFDELDIGCLNVDAGDVESSWRWLDLNYYGGLDELVRQEVGPVEAGSTGGIWGAHIASGSRLADMDAGEFQGLLQRLKEGNASYLYGADLTGLSEDRLLALNSVLGYTLWIRRVQMPEEIHANYRLRLNLTWQNDGSAAMAQDWPVEVALYRDGERVFGDTCLLDVRTLLPGDTETYVTVDVPHDIAPGEYDVTVAIIDPQTGENAVVLAMDCERVDDRAVVGKVIVQ